MLAALRCDKFSEACSTAHRDSDVCHWAAPVARKVTNEIEQTASESLKIPSGFLLSKMASFALKLYK